MQVPCVAVVENMSYFDADGQRYFPFGKGSGQRVVKDFGLPNLFQFPIEEHLSAAGDGESLGRRPAARVRAHRCIPGREHLVHAEHVCGEMGPSHCALCQ